MAILGVYDVDSLPNPLSRVEVLLYKLATGDDNLDDVKSFLSEHEELLAEIIRNGGVGGNIDIEYVLYTLSTEFNTLYNTAEKPVKSAILKGNTLVNLLTQFMSSVKYVDSQYRIDFKNVGNFDKITVVNKNSKPIKFLYYTNTWHSCQISAFNNALVEIPEEVVTYYISVSNITGWDSANYREATDNIVLLHGDYVNQDIPYFEGMQSVNLYPNQTIKKITWSSGRYYTETGTLTSVNATANHKYFEDYFDVLPNHTLRVIGNNTTKYLNFYDESKTFISRSTLTSTGDLVATVPSNARYYRYSMLVNSGMTDETVIYDEDMKINIADTSIDSDYLQKMGVLQTSNEDGTKTNILTVNETVELRKVGEVKDELDLLTGEVTRRVGELVLDGS
ncbi:MAG: hypothetical protein IJD87_02010, partial [Turicibacter sp.]|nr:hypothetical protein [Turicibacter sp.]